MAFLVGRFVLAGKTVGRQDRFGELLHRSLTCDVVTIDGSALFITRDRERRAGTPDADGWVIFPRTPFTREPLGPVVRGNDSEWFDAVNWTVLATFIAGENDVTSRNIDATRGTTPELTRLFGGEDEVQTMMGLSSDAFYQVIKQVGSYDEIYDRNLTVLLGIPREDSLNDWLSNGGLIFSPLAR